MRGTGQETGGEREPVLRGHREAGRKPLSECWNNLLDHIDAREQKLKGSWGDPQVQPRVADALIRIHEKYTSISSDLAGTSTLLYHLIRKHEGFVNDLVALEGQGIRETATTNTLAHIFSLDVLKCVPCDVQVRALEGWAQGVVCGLRAEEKVRDLGRAQSLKAEQ
ncbi:SPTBN5 [Cordylochernes scorpioides]|uniref:SPTBN5 n=1 Tax=Cordylochernes scorpioides TaxID=51811 RepID=A0ABY6JWS6_9ARAC|nr:SPTBN5 [Cordylochernes scorpioides]